MDILVAKLRKLGLREATIGQGPSQEKWATGKRERHDRERHEN